MTALAVAEILEPDENDLTPQEAILVRRGKAAIRRGHHEMIELGAVLNELKAITQPGRFLEIVKREFGLSRDLSAMWMRLAEHKPFNDVATSLHVPQSPYALDQLRRLNDEQFEAAIASGDIHADLTVREAEELTKRYLAPAPYAIERTPHRPEASKCGPPVAPRGLHARSWSELAYLLIERRNALGLSQAALDDKIGWGDGQTSKYEIPHQDDGRIPRADHLLEWAQGLGVRFEMVAV